MNEISSGLSLPPKVCGNTRANLELRLEELSFSILKLKKVPAKVFVRWWGQSLNEGIYFTPKIVSSLSASKNSFPSNKGVRVAVYKVVSGNKRFREYLEDAERLFLEIHYLDQNSQTQIIGYSILEDLSRLVDKNLITDDLDIFDENGHLIGCLRLKMFYDLLSSPIASCDSSQFEKKDLPLREPFVLRSKVKNNSRLTDQPQQDARTNNTRVKFSEVDSVHQTSLDNDLHDHDKITLNGLKDHSKTKYCSHQTDFLETEVHQYLDSSFEERKDEDETNNVTEHLLNHTFEVDDCENLARNKADNFVNVLHDSNQHLLRNPERLHELKKADQIMVCIKKLKLAREILKKISAFDLCLKPARRPIAKQDTDWSKISYFVKFSMPNCRETSCCGLKKHRKRTQKDETLFQEVSFDHKSFYTINLEDPRIFASWASKSISFKVYSRALGQMIPTFVGESILPLEHWIHSDQQGLNLQLPIVPSETLACQFSEQTSDKIGVLTLDFLFSRSSNPDKNLQSKKVKPSDPVTPFDVMPRMNGLTDTLKDQPKKFASTQKDQKNLDNVLQTLLEITGGKDFQIHDKTIQNVFISCRFLGSGDLLSSQICWNIDNPNFNFRHSIPIRLNTDFLEKCCKSNVLIIEVWSFSTPKNKLIGIATVPLHQIYVSYKDPQRVSLVMSLKLPVVTIDNWIEVLDVLSGEKVASIKVLFAIGKEVQITNLLRDHQNEMEPLSKIDDALETKTCTRENFAQTLLSEAEQGTDDESNLPHKIIPSKALNLDNVHVQKQHLSTETCETKFSHASETQNMQEPRCFCKTVQATEKTSYDLSVVHLRVSITEGRNLPRLKSRLNMVKLPPNSYVSLPSVEQGSRPRPPVSVVIEESCCPKWNFTYDLKLPISFFEESRQHLIIKVWHCDVTKNDCPTSENFQDLLPDFERDPIIGFVAVDLNPLIMLSGRFENLCGWYNIMDFVGRCRGQVHLNVIPINAGLLDRQLRSLNLDSSSDEDSCPSRSNSDCNKISTNLDLSESENGPIEDFDIYVDDELATKSFLASKLSDLTNLAEKLKQKLEANSVQDSFSSSHLSSQSTIQNASKPRFGSGEPNQKQCLVSTLVGFNIQNEDLPFKHPGAFQDEKALLTKPFVTGSENSCQNEKEQDLLTFSVSPASIPDLDDLLWDERAS